MDAVSDGHAATIAPRPNRLPLRVGALVALSTVAFLTPGAGRSYDLDSGLTIGYFVATRSIGDTFTKTYLFTNQVFFSFLEHLVYSSTGSTNEAVMRLLPIAASAAAVGTLAYLLAGRFGAVAGLAGAAVLLTNPLFAVEGSQVRGYSIVVLCAIVTTAIFVRSGSEEPLSTAARIGYAVAGAIGVATHLYMLVVLGIHAIMSLSSRRRVEQLALPWLASLLGLCAYIRMVHSLHAVVRVMGRDFQPTFPRDLAVDVLGGTIVATVMTLAIVAPVGWSHRRDRLVQLGGVAAIAAVLAAWLIAPRFLYPRFFLWLMPIVAIAVAAAVAKRRLVLVLVFTVIVLQVHTVWPRLMTDPFPNGQTAQIFKKVRAHKQQACAVDAFTVLRLVAYKSSFGVLTRAVRGPCAVAVEIGVPPEGGVARSLDRIFPYRATLHAETPGLLWSVLPTACWTSERPPPDCGLDR